MPELVKKLDDSAVVSLLYDWYFWARPEQRVPVGDWFIWLILSGRGWGKTRTGAETVRRWVEDEGIMRIHLIGRTAADVRDVMIEGESGILATASPFFYPNYEPSKRRLTWPNGAVATTFSSEKYDQLRGPQCERFWIDELAAFQFPEETLDQVIFGARLGHTPCGVITTTPRPTKTIKALVADTVGTFVTKGSTLDNIANLAASAVKRMYDKYGGTRMGKQELLGEILDDNPNALWRREWIEEARVSSVPDELLRIVVAIDPAITSSEDSAETGIVAAAMDYADPPHFYLLRDDSCSRDKTPHEWAVQACATFSGVHADAMVAETNQGGDLILDNIALVNPNIAVAKIHAKVGKKLRAEPVSALYEQGRVHHLGHFPECEDQMCEWDPASDSSKKHGSPDRIDALVYALLELAFGAGEFMDGGRDVMPD